MVVEVCNFNVRAMKEYRLVAARRGKMSSPKRQGERRERGKETRGEERERERKKSIGGRGGM